MPYANVDDRLQFHPKRIEVGFAGIGLFVLGLSYVASYGTDGFIPDLWVEAQVGQEKGADKLPPRLVAAGFWQRTEGGYRVHDYLDYNMSAAQWKARKLAGKKGGEASAAKRRRGSA